MYAVVVIGSRMRRSACGMNLRTFSADAEVATSASPSASARSDTATTFMVFSLSKTETRCVRAVRSAPLQCGGFQPGATSINTMLAPSSGCVATQHTTWPRTGRLTLSPDHRAVHDHGFDADRRLHRFFEARAFVDGRRIEQRDIREGARPQL